MVEPEPQAAPQCFLNVTGVVTKSCGRAGRSLSLAGAARRPRSTPGTILPLSGLCWVLCGSEHSWQWEALVLLVQGVRCQATCKAVAG